MNAPILQCYLLLNNFSFLCVVFLFYFISPKLFSQSLLLFLIDCVVSYLYHFYSSAIFVFIIFCHFLALWFSTACSKLFFYLTKNFEVHWIALVKYWLPNMTQRWDSLQYKTVHELICQCYHPALLIITRILRVWLE